MTTRKRPEEGEAFDEDDDQFDDSEVEHEDRDDAGFDPAEN
jgi:hypothetical protein